MSPKPRLPSRLLDESIDRTLAVFQPMTDRRLSRQDAHEIRGNLLGFFETLRECADAAEAAADGGER